MLEIQKSRDADRRDEDDARARVNELEARKFRKNFPGERSRDCPKRKIYHRHDAEREAFLREAEKSAVPAPRESGERKQEQNEQKRRRSRGGELQRAPPGKKPPSRPDEKKVQAEKRSRQRQKENPHFAQFKQFPPRVKIAFFLRAGEVFPNGKLTKASHGRNVPAGKWRLSENQ